MSIAPNPSTIEWKTGNRVPMTGEYVDQYGYHSTHYIHGTFPPCINRKGECAFRKLVRTF